MKANKTYPFILIAVMLLSLGALSQPDTLRIATRSQQAVAMADRMERELKLTPDQKGQVLNLMVGRFENIKSGYALDVVNNKAYDKLSTILTNEQRTLYLKLKADTKRQKDEFLSKNPNYTFPNEDKELDF